MDLTSDVLPTGCVVVFLKFHGVYRAVSAVFGNDLRRMSGLVSLALVVVTDDTSISCALKQKNLSGLTDQRFSILVHNPSLRWCVYSCTLLQRQLWQQASSCCASIELWCSSCSLPVLSVFASVQRSHEAIVTYVDILLHMYVTSICSLERCKTSIIARAVLLLQKQDVSITETEQLLEISQGDWVSCVGADTQRTSGMGGDTSRDVLSGHSLCRSTSLWLLLVG